MLAIGLKIGHLLFLTGAMLLGVRRIFGLRWWGGWHIFALLVFLPIQGLSQDLPLLEKCHGHFGLCIGECWWWSFPEVEIQEMLTEIGEWLLLELLWAIEDLGYVECLFDFELSIFLGLLTLDTLMTILLRCQWIRHRVLTCLTLVRCLELLLLVYLLCWSLIGPIPTIRVK